MTDLLRDLRFAVRRLAGAPAFTITVALVLALGLGAGAVIFGAEPALAAYLPARRAARLHRMEVLRQE